MTGPAPFFADVADAPPGGASWVRAADGVRLRLGRFDARPARGTVLVLPGRTEAIEKYGRVARALVAAELSVLAIDWRGQGLSDRLADDPRLGHVGRWRDYQLDVDAMIDAARDMPRPLTLLAHSMGGAIGLRALHRDLGIERAAFSAPMWDINVTGPRRPAAWALSWAARRLGHGVRYAPGTGPVNSDVVRFAGNPLTTCPETHAWMMAQVEAHPDLALGGPSLQWLIEALAECRRLRAKPPPAVRAVIGLGTAERIVSQAAIREMAARWDGARLLEYPGAEHELLMEAPPARDAFLSEIVRTLTARAPAPAA